jgi:outer membrane protein TolC
MKMQSRIDLRQCLLAAGMLLMLGAHCRAQAGALSLADAEAIAIQNDPSIRMVESTRTALSERAVAAGELPDPMVKLGVGGLPVDSFNLGQEPMTQVQFGLVQHFPRGRTRHLRSAQINQRAEGLEAAALDQILLVKRSVRESYLEVLKQTKLAMINDEAIEVFTDLADITRDYYANGRVPQHDVLRASVELSRVRDRATRILQQEDAARARLAAWIGDAAFREFEADWPGLASPVSETELKAGLERHPRIRALQQNVIAAQTGVDLARQKYKPGFAVDVTYGGRGGLNPDGQSRSDLLSMMVVMDVPLFTDRRQDRLMAASVAESSAAAFGRDDVYRQMHSEIELHAANLRREQERLDLFENTLLPETEFNADATFEAYQAAVEDLTTLMRARITEFEMELEYASLQAEVRKTQSRMLYLEGEQK